MSSQATQNPLTLPRVIALANQKGGVGKTTTAINLGTALAAIGERVLIIDLDPQGNASTGLGIDSARRHITIADILGGDATLAAAALPTAVPRLALIPASMALLEMEFHLASRKDRALRLRQALDETVSPHDKTGLHNGESAYSYILIDCPPALNILTINAMAAANAVLVPLQCEFFALEGLSQLLATIRQVQATLNARLQMHGIVMTMFDSRNNLAAQVVADVRQTMGEAVYDTIIPRNVRVSEAPSFGKPALLYDLKCTGSQAYLQLASEIIRREQSLHPAAA